MKNKFIASFILFVSIIIACDVALSQQKWIPTNVELAVKKDWTFYRKTNDYPNVEFRLDSMDTSDYFDCSYYNYFSDTAFPRYSYADSVKCAEYMEYYYKLDGLGTPHPEFYSNFLPYVYNELDTFWIHKLKREKENFQFDSLNYKYIFTTLENDAVFKGRIIAKRYPRDSTICLNFSTVYVIEVLDTIHAYFKLQQGDKVLVYDQAGGYTKPCDKSSDINDTYHFFGHKTNYPIGDTALFFLDRTHYKFIMRHYKYEDKKKFCHQVLALSNIDNTFIKSYKKDIEKIKLFFKTKYHEK